MAEFSPWAILASRAFVSVILGFLALVHALWAVGLWWPARDEDHLVASVVGARGATRMPGAIPCLVVAAGLSIGAVLPWLPQHGVLGQWYSSVAAILAVIFAVRAALILVAPWRRATAHEPFATLDRRLYVPVCVLLTLSFWVLSTL